MQGRTNNFAHTSLQELCKSFYYVGANKIAAQFPDEFSEAVPPLAVALATTAVSFSGLISTLLTELCTWWVEDWLSGHPQIQFNSILHVMEIGENDPYHGGKFMQSRIDWARQGR